MKVTGIVDKWDTEKKTCKNRNFSLLKPRTHKHHEGERERLGNTKTSPS